MCDRITCVLAKELKKQQGTKKLKVAEGESIPRPTGSEPPQPQLLSKGAPVDLEISIEEALKLSELKLKVGDDVFDCVIDPPRVKEVTLTLAPMVGMPVYCDAEAVNADTLNYHWFLGINNTVKKTFEERGFSYFEIFNWFTKKYSNYQKQK